MSDFNKYLIPALIGFGLASTAYYFYYANSNNERKILSNALKNTSYIDIDTVTAINKNKISAENFNTELEGMENENINTKDNFEAEKNTNSKSYYSKKFF